MKPNRVALLVLTLHLFASADARDRIEQGNLILENVPETPSALADSIRRRREFSSMAFLDWSGNDSGMLVTRRVDAVGQIHEVSTPQASGQQLTFSTDSLGSAVAQPGGNSFVYPKDKNGDEYYQLYLHHKMDGSTTCITDGRKSRNLGAIWSKDGKQLAYLHSPEGSQRYQIRVAHIDAIAEPKTVLDQDGAFSIDDWSPDGTVLLVSRYVSMTESYLYTLSLKTRELREINPQPSKAPRISYSGGQYPQFLGGFTGGRPRGARFSPDGASIYAISDQNSEFSRLVRIDLPSGNQSVVSKNIDWDIDGLDVSPDGSMLVYSVNENGISKLHFLNLRSGAELPAPVLTPGVIGNRAFNHPGNRFAFTFVSATSPSDIYVWDTGKGVLTRWSDSEVRGIDPALLVQPELVRFSSFDKRTISAFLYRPKHDGKLPVLIDIHGGPEYQFRPVFSPYGPVITGLALGFAVLAPNVRGSTGYGKTFGALDNGMKREDAVQDVGALLDWVANQPFLDKDRVVLHGASYGGYMVNASMIRFRDRVKAGISIVAISDFHSFLENTAEYRRDLRRAEYGDERKPDMASFMRRIAPLSRASEISAPMFIVHGANDPRVPVTEAEQLYSVLEAKGSRPWLMIAKDEGHGFRKEANVLKLDESVTIFLETVVLGRATGTGQSLIQKRE